MLYYINKKSENLKGFIGEKYYEIKSTILAMLALAHSLNNKNIDIITLSKYLSKKYFQKYKQVYNFFGIKSSYFNDKKIDNSTQIIYGILQDFQFNIIKEMFCLGNNLENIERNNLRKRNLIFFEDIDILINSKSFNITALYSNNFTEN